MSDRTFTRPEAAPDEDRDPLAGGQAAADASEGERPGALWPGDDSVVWAWATEHSAPERATTRELVSWLARGELAPHTLVWRPGWGEWLPALQVAELAAAFPQLTPGNRRKAQAAPAGSNLPPPVPVGHCPRLRLLAKDVVTGSSPFTSVSQGLAPARAGRRSFHDLDELQQDVVTSQVPAAAMLEAARAMKALGPAVSRSERWSQLDLGTFGESPPRSGAGERGARSVPEHPRPASSPPGRTLSPHALELDFSTLAEPELELPWGRRRRYGPWLALGLLVGSGLGLLAVDERSLQALLHAWTSTDQTADAANRPPAFRAVRVTGVDELGRGGTPAQLRGLSVAPHDGFDRVVFEFRERVPSFHADYVAGPSSGCGSSQRELGAGESWLEVRFEPADAAAVSAELAGPQPALGIIAEVARTCAERGVVTWAISSASLSRFRAFEQSEPPRLVVDIER
jgi:hypothetical protein